jgi:hydrogenase expression/formation protein HypC
MLRRVCLALPARVCRVDADGSGVVELAGVKRTVSFALLDEVAVGDHVIVHVGYALTRLDTAEAEATLRAFADLDEANTPKDASS